MTPAGAIARRTLRDSRTRTLSFALLFAFAAAAQGTSYRGAYPTLADRVELARTFGDNRGTRLLYGTPHDLLTTGGWLSWRLGSLPVFAALGRYLRAENAAGFADVDDPDVAAAQFLGMISTVVFWPRLVHGNWSLSEEETRKVVDDAVRTIVARYAAPVSIDGGTGT